MMNKQKKVMVIEQNLIIALALKEALEDAGPILAETVESWEAFMSTLSEFGPDLIVLDEATLRLGGDPGQALELADRIGVPLIFTTTSFDGVKALPGADVVMKPFEISRLVNKIKSRLGLC